LSSSANWSSGMKITKVEPILPERGWLLVKVQTDEGIYGIGECLVDKAGSIIGAIREFEDYLVGKDPLRIELHWQAMYRGSFWRGGPVINSAISGIEIALWDILGKSLNAPIYQLLGGACRERIRIYDHIGGKTLDELSRSAEKAMKSGVTAVKWSPFGPTKASDSPAVIKSAVAQVKAVREVIGDDADLMVDMHGRLSPAMAVIMAEEIAPYRPLFIEEPCLPENADAMARVASKVSVPVATGERLFTRFGFREVLERGAAAIIQPDLSICGGILEAKKIAAMAEAYYVAVAPHNPYGPVLLAASVQLDACIPNFLIQEHSSFGEGIFREPLVVEGGYIRLPEGPGLGVELDERRIGSRPFKPWKMPIWYHEDGSVADW